MKFKANLVSATFNRINDTLQALPNIKKTASADIPFMLTVVDNGSTDGSVNALKSLYKEGIIDNLILLPENVGVSKAQNLGWKLFESQAEIFGKVDNDVIFTKDNWLNPLIEVIDNAPEVGAIGYNCEAKNTYAIVQSGEVSYRFKGGNVGGACFFVTPQAHTQLGYWCEDFDKYGEEDADMGVRVMMSGLKNAYMNDEEVMLHLPEITNDYRKFKDQQRRDNLSGPWQSVYNGYASRTRSLRVETNVHKDLTYEFYSHHFKKEELV